MIAYIKGIVASINEEAVFVEVNGIGYEIYCANPFVFQDQIETETRIFTYHYVREDAQVLYGFKKIDEKQLFSKLLNVSGIGPKGALAILASAQVETFAAAIEQEDEKFLTSFSGVGKKTARQMILDLKGKLPVPLPTSEPTSSGSKEAAFTAAEKWQALEEAMEAMRSLGYSEREIKAIIPDLKQETHADTDKMIRKGLALMMQK